MTTQLPLDTTNSDTPQELQTPRDPSGRSFIEVQFPVSKLSKESYKERKSAQTQTLTNLGKWWGRKPLVLIRAIILGLLLPSTDDKTRDRETFLALMTMDDDGMWRRAGESIPLKVAYQYALLHEQREFFQVDQNKLKWRSGLSAQQRRRMQRRAFLRMSYDRRLEFCGRPEEIDGPSAEVWAKINAHLGTSAASLNELVSQLSERCFGHSPRVGDACCGGGSIPFEAARLGCKAYGSDLSPAAMLLTWGGLHIVGGGESVVAQIRAAQERVFNAVQQQIDVWGIERNEKGWIADAYLYCNEVLDPLTGWRIPLAPSWVIAEKTKVIARLIPDNIAKRFDFEIIEGASSAEMIQADAEGTWNDGVVAPVGRDGIWLTSNQRQKTSVDQLRGREGLRRWENADLVPRSGDIFQERLYCIRWRETITLPNGRMIVKYHYCLPTVDDLKREKQVLALLRERFADWQARGYIPSRRIEQGESINRPTNARGWTYWHHFFNPRQLLSNGLFFEKAAQEHDDAARAMLLLAGRLPDWNSRLSRWQFQLGGGIGRSIQTFYKPSLNTPPANYCSRPMAILQSTFCINLSASPIHNDYVIQLCDARAVNWLADIWITDPGYADAIFYEEISEFFLAWYEKHIPQLFPGWYSDSKRALAVSGTGEHFRLTLAECYKRLAAQMSDDGFQVVMFTHQSAEVWADVALVLWSAGLQVTAAWTVATETESAGIKQGNHVQGTVVLVLRKRKGNLRGDLSDLYPDMQTEVQSQLQSMTELDPKDDPNFGDTDYQLAAYAAALRVITGYSVIDEIDVEHELRRIRTKGEKSPVTGLIEQAVKIASDFLVPDGIERTTWRKLGPEERLYLKGISVESHGEMREGVYQEMARGYGSNDYRTLLASRVANKVRLKTPIELGSRDLHRPDDAGFGGSLLRYVLFAVYKTATDPERDPRGARQFLRQELPSYWGVRQTILELLQYLSSRPDGLSHWDRDVQAARLLRGSIEGDAM